MTESHQRLVREEVVVGIDGLRLDLEDLEESLNSAGIVLECEQSVSNLCVQDHLLMEELHLALVISFDHISETTDVLKVTTLIDNDLEFLGGEGLSLDEVER